MIVASYSPVLTLKIRSQVSLCSRQKWEYPRSPPPPPHTHTHLGSSPRDCEMTFIIGRGSAELQILKKVKMTLSLELSGILWWNFAYTLILTRCSPSDCKILFRIGQGFAEVQILKEKWNWLYLLNLLVNFDDILHTHYYRHNLDREIAKSSPSYCKMTSVEAVPSSKFWKSESGRTERNIVMKFCIHIYMDKM